MRDEHRPAIEALAMWLKLRLRISTVAIIAAFAALFTVFASRADAHHNTPAYSVMSAITYEDGGCVHDGCSIPQHHDSHGTCFASGTATSALPPASSMRHFALVQDVLRPSLDRAMIEQIIEPDPHPPKDARSS
ncbi:MAG TPA: hypothetical protein VHA37_06395 [Candidatus Saccharimonadales bacterium]|nr:hypothetical protein [Candidatus Saccharimonadales bacterium]